MSSGMSTFWKISKARIRKSIFKKTFSIKSIVSVFYFTQGFGQKWGVLTEKMSWKYSSHIREHHLMYTDAVI
jgi:hypothetical protein